MIGNKPLVSVLIPAYNHEKYVQETIKSIINQTYQNIELIIVDDGSKDSTWQKIQEIKEECEKRFVRVHFETKENEGTCKTLNRLLDLSTSEYIYLIASDDMAKPEAIETEVKFLSKHKDYALCVGDNEFIDGEGKRAYWDSKQNLVYEKKQAEYITFANFLQKDRRINFKSSVFGTYNELAKVNHIPNGYLIRKSIFENFGYFTPDAPLEDYWLMLQISKFAKMKYINKILFSYRWHNLNTIQNGEKMNNILEKTRNHEKKILDNIKLDNCLQNFIEYKKFGSKYFHFGINNLFEINKYKNENKKTRVLKIFNINFIL